MTRGDELMKAIGAHGQWKMRLRNAIQTGKLDVPADTVKADDQCVFGQWLKTLTSVSEAEEPYLAAVKKLHSEFHRIAGQAAGLVTNGKLREAEGILENGGAFATASTKLTEAIMAWKSNLGQ
jgi:hypothetical protein